MNDGLWIEYDRYQLALVKKIRRYIFYLLLSIVQILSFMISIIAYKQIKNSRCRYCIKISDSDLGLISCIILFFFLKLQTIIKCFPIVTTYSNQSLSFIILFRFIFGVRKHDRDKIYYGNLVAVIYKNYCYKTSFVSCLSFIQNHIIVYNIINYFYIYIDIEMQLFMFRNTFWL